MLWLFLLKLILRHSRSNLFLASPLPSDCDLLGGKATRWWKVSGCSSRCGTRPKSCGAPQARGRGQAADKVLGGNTSARAATAGCPAAITRKPEAKRERGPNAALLLGSLGGAGKGACSKGAGCWRRLEEGLTAVRKMVAAEQVPSLTDMELRVLKAVVHAECSLRQWLMMEREIWV